MYIIKRIIATIVTPITHMPIFISISQAVSEIRHVKFKKNDVANFQTTIFLVLLNIESCLMAHFEGIT